MYVCIKKEGKVKEREKSSNIEHESGCIMIAG